VRIVWNNTSILFLSKKGIVIYQNVLLNCKSKKKLARLLFIDYPYEYKKIYDSYNQFPLKHFHRFDKKMKQGSRIMFRIDELSKKIHTRILELIIKGKQPDFLKSGIRKESYLTNASMHSGSNYFLLLDISKFFPSTKKQDIKYNLIHYYKTSNDIAEFLSTIVTAPYQTNYTDRALVTGSPLSQYFSYFINKRLFDEIYQLSKANDVIFSLYVDDISFSSNKTIPYEFLKKVFSLIKSNGYSISRKKTYYGKISKHSEITGVKISRYGKFLTDSRKKRIKNKVQELTRNKNNLKLKESLKASIQQACCLNNRYAKYYRFLQYKKIL
jgi:hypothetical protein